MARKAVSDAVKARMAGWSGPPVQYPNETSDARDDAGAFIMLQFPVANEETITVGAPGDNIWREEGVFRFVIHTMRNSGVDQALQLADDIATLFRGQTFDGVQAWGVSSQVDDENDDAGYFKLAVAVAYQHDIAA